VAKKIGCKKWTQAPKDGTNFELITKLSDLGAPLSKKTLLSFYMNVTKSSSPTPNTERNPYYEFHIFYRTDVNNGWKGLTQFFSSGDVDVEKSNYFHLTKFVIRNVRNMQLRIFSPRNVGSFEINDFGLEYRARNKRSTATHDED